MRKLTKPEISVLEQQHCTCNNWSDIDVSDEFSPHYIRNVHFSGHITLGTFEKSIEQQTGVFVSSGIYNARLHNCTIGNNVYIRNIGRYIANYEIEADVCIENVQQLSVEGSSSFGNGTKVNPLNESGGREITIYEELSSHIAYLMVLYRHRPMLMKWLNRLVDKYVESHTSTHGRIGRFTTINNCGSITNVSIGSYARLENVAELHNGTVSSSETNPTRIGTGVIARHFIIGKGSKVYDQAILEKCFIGQACEVGKQYSAIDSLIFCNSQLLHGEATAIFAGPYTTTHHKSTLLIGSMFSFYNAGSGTNQSNHLYKLGPVHQGIFERGTKTGSDSYLMLEARAGAFSLILGHHEQHFDTSNLPFSYIMDEGGRSVLIPAVNFQTVGTQRDAQKWPKRDNRQLSKNDETADFITFDLLNPHIIQKIKNGIAILKGFAEKASEFHSYKGVRIKNIFLSKGIHVYEAAIMQYIGERLLTKLLTVGLDAKRLQPSTVQGGDSNENWLDVAGLVLPQSLLEENLQQIEVGKVSTIEAVGAWFSNVYDDYAHYEWSFLYRLIEEYFGKPLTSVTKEELTVFFTKYIEAVAEHAKAVVSDAEKEFAATNVVSFGIDGDEEIKRADFEQVRGRLSDNAFVQSVIERKEKEEKRVNELMKLLK